VVVFNFATKHSAWGGGNQRRMFTINATAHYQPEDIGYLKGIISGAAMTDWMPASRTNESRAFV